MTLINLMTVVIYPGPKAVAGAIDCKGTPDNPDNPDNLELASLMNIFIHSYDNLHYPGDILISRYRLNTT